MKTRYILKIPKNKINTKKAQELQGYELDGKECYYKVAVSGKYWCFSKTPQGFTIPDSWLHEIPGQSKTAGQAWDDLYAGKKHDYSDPIHYFKKGWEAAYNNLKFEQKLNSQVTGRTLIKDILDCGDIDKEITISVDVSTCEEDSEKRVYTDDYFGVNDVNQNNEIVLIFHGSPND